MLAQVLAAVLRILSLVSGISTLVSVIQGDVTSSAQETTKFLIQTNTTETLNDLLDPTIGLSKIVSNQALIISAVAAARSDILTAIANLTNGTTPISLPPTPPPPYAPPSSGANSNAVWNTLILDNNGSPRSTLQAMQNLLISTLNWQDFAAFQFRQQPFVYAEAEPAEDNFSLSLFNPPPLRAANLRRSDTVMSFFTREAPSFSWTQDTTHGGRVYALVSGETLAWVSNYYDGGLQAAVFGVSSSAATPIWPGLSGVTLGTPVAIAPQMNVAGPMQGVIINITSVDPNRTSFDVGGLIARRNIGTCTFVDDNGQAESVHFLNFQDAIELPHSMASAASFRLQNSAGLVGTITPFTIP